MTAQRLTFSCSIAALSRWSSSCPWYKAVMIASSSCWLEWYFSK